ncbi:AraC family transcriptional regulator [Amorphoplanes digitatis]|uniref:AraC-like DNA-binding protein n=1 Tax=Actinoplanes digitatis TaxID=1868 RepID=A0A7W7MRU5_9ACTN|nr:AraC family transcriptional regulator [Actinoplanes digitatis]MBB4764077.1 AraC-like DNA-binding protein [Actinoplanes digitatis]GID97355.1 putative transcriptional regulatory, AraC family protein [Actinoplanes digitatis]
MGGSKPSIRYATLSGYLQLTQSFGADPAALMRAVDLDPADLATPDKWVPAVRAVRLLELSARACDHADFGLKLAEFRGLSTLGPLSLALRGENTLRDALGLLMRYEHTYNEAIRIRLVETEGLASIRLWFELGEPAPSTQAEELAVGALHGIVRAVLGPRWQPLSACFSHAAPADVETHTALFGGRVHFGHDFTGLVLYAKDLDAPNLLADTGPGRRLDELLTSLAAPRGRTTSDRVRDLVEVLLPTGRCAVDQVARTVGMDRRTLHRHLAAEGETFTSIVDVVRAGLAERYLSNERYRLTEISDLLGFAAPSAFSRWFRNRFGDSPSQWRARRADLPAA